MSSQPLPAQPKQLFHYLFQQASLGVAVEDLEGKLLLANPALCSMLGYSESDLLAMSCSEFANPEDSEDDWALFQQLRAGVIDKYSLEKRYVRKDGTRFWGRLNVSLLTGSEEGSSRLISAFVEDITERKRAEEDLTEVQRLAGFGSWQWDAKTDQVIWSKEIYLRTGHDPNLPPPRFSEQSRLFTAESWDRLQRAVEEAVQAGTSCELDVELVGPKSTTQWATTRGEPVRDASGQIVGLRGTFQYITERKRAEVALRESEQRFRLAVQAGRMYAFDWDVVTDVIVRSIESVHILNWKNPERDTGREFHARIHPDDRALYDAMEARLTPENPTYQISFRTLRPDGTATWLEDTGRASFDAHGKMVRVIGMVADITARVPDPAQLPAESDRQAAARALEYMGLAPGTPLEGIPIDRVFLGSCTNARIEDLRTAANVVRGRHVSSRVRAMVVPGSQRVKAQAEREGLDRVFRDAGFEWRNAGCSMCLGMNPDVLGAGERCAATSNRNFEGRQGRGGRTHLMSPAMAAAAAIEGRLVDVRGW